MSNIPLSGKGEKSYCVPQYFAWVNHGNDGSSEEQTLKNLDFFAYLNREFGMQLEIYALDAGNFDSPMENYYNPDHPMTKKNFPHWLKPIADYAAELGIKLGMWCGPDGFGNNEKEEQERFEQVVSLCRDYHVALLKFDLVCGPLRAEKQKVFEKMIATCRKYCPELIVLNHRLELGDAQKYATTFLWGGQETYVDVLMNNVRTAPHHRQGALERGLVPDLKRLTEDHGVCLSSCLDYFEDELVLQAFNRALILSPEIYGTPAFLRDDEFPRLARIYNLSKKFAHLLVDGIVLDEKYGSYAVSRGNGKTRILTFRNNSWENIKIRVNLNQEIGLVNNGQLSVIQYYPVQRVLGQFSFGSEVDITVEPFRVCMIYVSCEAVDDILIENCDYEVIRDVEGKPILVNIVRAEDIKIVNNRNFEYAQIDGKSVDICNHIMIDVDEYLYPPIKLCNLEKCLVPSNAEQLYEATCFHIDNDSLERRAVQRSGNTNIKEVQQVRDAFFSQLAYEIRGCDSSYMFDGRENTFFDSITRPTNQRICGGCLRIDLNDVYDIDTMVIEYFDVVEDNEYIKKNLLPKVGTSSTDLIHWADVQLTKSLVIKDKQAPIALQTVDRVKYIDGKLMNAEYSINNSMRYIRIPEPMDRIYSIKFYKNNRQIKLKTKPKANNMMAAYPNKVPKAAFHKKVKLPRFKTGSYLSLACEGQHGIEGTYCVGMYKENILTCPDRVTSYPANYWGHWVCSSGANYTYYLPLNDDLQEQEIDLFSLICKDGDEKFHVDVYLCSPNDSKNGATLLLK